MGIYWSRHHSWCCVKGRLHAAARRRRARKYCKCGNGRRFRRPKWLMFRRRSVFTGCTPCAESDKCCHEQGGSNGTPIQPCKSILATQKKSSSSKTKTSECACTKQLNCGDKMIQQTAGICRFTVDAYFT